MSDSGSRAPAFDVVLATVGRSTEVARFLKSLVAQGYPRLRLIVVDQNRDDRLGPILEEHEQSISIVRLRSDRGASRARNVGLMHLRGDLVAFADDDCWYPAGLLDTVAGLLARHPEWDAVSGRAIDADGRGSAGRLARSAGEITRLNVWTRALAIGLFLRRRVVEGVGSFDERLGPGSGTLWGSGDETDYVLRALAAGFTVRYEPKLTVFHPQVRQDFTPATRAAGARYGAGMGGVLRKHRYPAWFALYWCCRAVAGAVLALASGHPRAARYHMVVARGRMRGWLDPPPDQHVRA